MKKPRRAKFTDFKPMQAELLKLREKNLRLRTALFFIANECQNIDAATVRAVALGVLTITQKPCSNPKSTMDTDETK